MCNPKTATADYTTFSGMEKEIQEKAARPKRQLAPVFKPYNNRQSFAIFDVEKALGVAGTARNWRTVTTLLEIAKATSP